jgi:drug/metabolite transporter (DMT)-like permease
MLQTITILTVVALGTIYGDYMIKLASMSQRGLMSHHLLLGATIYGLTAIGWMYMMKDHSLLQIGIFYSCTMILMLAALGYFVFHERADLKQILGGALAIASVILAS